jgi:hypothetical protein
MKFKVGVAEIIEDSIFQGYKGQVSLLGVVIWETPDIYSDYERAESEADGKVVAVFRALFRGHLLWDKEGLG